MDGLNQHEPIRVWVVGCSTGQEAYSLAMAFTESAEPRHVGAASTVRHRPECERDRNARRGSVFKGHRPGRLVGTFTSLFLQSEDGYRISKTIRDLCVFSRHNVLTDPPFSRIDLISCRNLLIYLEPVLQRVSMPILHYALKPNGHLWLGGSERSARTVSCSSAGLEAQDLYQDAEATAALSHARRVAPNHSRPPSFLTCFAIRSIGGHLHREADRDPVEPSSPRPACSSPTDLEILQYRGDTGAYLRLRREGEPEPAEDAPRRTAGAGPRGRHSAGKARAPVRSEDVRVKTQWRLPQWPSKWFRFKGRGAEGWGLSDPVRDPAAGGSTDACRVRRQSLMPNPSRLRAVTISSKSWPPLASTCNV